MTLVKLTWFCEPIHQNLFDKVIPYVTLCCFLWSLSSPGIRIILSKSPKDLESPGQFHAVIVHCVLLTLLLSIISYMIVVSLHCCATSSISSLIHNLSEFSIRAFSFTDCNFICGHQFVRIYYDNDHAFEDSIRSLRSQYDQSTQFDALIRDLSCSSTCVSSTTPVPGVYATTNTINIASKLACHSCIGAQFSVVSHRALPYASIIWEKWVLQSKKNYGKKIGELILILQEK